MIRSLWVNGHLVPLREDSTWNMRLPLLEAEDPQWNVKKRATMIADILYGMYGKDAIHIAGKVLEARGKWNPLDHPRDARGRFIKKGSGEAATAAKSEIGKLKVQPATKENVEKIAGHLSLLTVKQLQELHKEHGIKAPGRLRAQLVKSITERLLAGEQKSDAPPVEATPDEKPADDKPAAEPTADDKLNGFIENSKASPEKKKKYAAAVKRVMDDMPKAAKDRIGKNLRHAEFHETIDTIATEAIADVEKDPTLTDEDRKKIAIAKEMVKKKEFVPGGMYSRTGRMDVDGDYPYLEKKSGKYSVRFEAKAHEVYAHELGHVIDGPKQELSNSAEWKEAFNVEIQFYPSGGGTPKLSQYGGSSPTEGFAEFSRLLYGSDVDLSQIEKDFPRASAFFKERGLWPERKSKGGGKFGEIFDKRIPLDGKNSHIDAVSTSTLDNSSKQDKNVGGDAEPSASKDTPTKGGDTSTKETPKKGSSGESRGEKHPFEGMTTNEEKATALSLEVNRNLSTHPLRRSGKVAGDDFEAIYNPRGYNLKEFPSGVDGDKLTADVTSTVADFTAKSPLSRMNVRQVYDAVKKSHPELNLHDFQASLAKMHADKKIRLGPYTIALSTLPDPDAAFPLDGEAKYYVSGP